MTTIEWVQFICIAIGGAFGLVCLFEGARGMAGRDASGRAGRLFGVGVVAVGMLAAYSYWQYWTYADVARSYLPAEQARELPEDWGKKMSPAKREAASRTMARGAFISSGKLGQYFDSSGQRKVYAPAQDDLKQRESVLATAARLEHRASDSLNEFILWLVLGLSASLFGLFFAFEPQAPDAEAEAEAAPPAKAPIAPNAAAPAKSTVGEDTIPLPKPAVGIDTIPLPKPPAGTKKA